MDPTVMMQVCAFQRRYLSMLVDDVPEEQMCAQAGGVVNHPAWHLGHLAFVTDRFGSALGAESTMEASWEKLFAPRSTPVADRAVYPSKAELLARLDDRRVAAQRAFLVATPQQLAQANPIVRLAGALPTIGHLAVFGFHVHESTHLGQLAVWRRVMGMPMAFLKMP